MAPRTETISGSVERVTFHADDTGFAILKIRLPNRREPATILGNTPAVNAGEKITAHGAWVNVPEYGRQFKASSIETAPPSSREGIERYLGSGLIHGIGPVYAKKLVDKFGDEIFDIIDNSSRRLEDVDGIGAKRRVEIKSSWEKQKAIREIMVFLYEYGVGTARALRIYKQYGDQAVRVLRKNPYQLSIDIHGVGFKTADEIARNLGIAETAPQRIVAGILHLLETAADQGHCALPEAELLEKAAELLNNPHDKIQSSLDSLISSGQLRREAVAVEASGSNLTLVYLPRLHAAEIGIATRIRRLAEQPARYPPIDIEKAVAWCREKIGIDLADAQIDAITEAIRNRLLIITGGPGVGKTTILNSILKILTAKKVRAVLCAPTGRAAKRLSASTGLEAKTIHRLLEYTPATSFGRDPDFPLKGDLFVMDESSMVDLPLMHAFLRALPNSAHLLLVGDVDQLPSVGPGNLLRDLIDSQTIETVRLTRIFRQAGDSRIVEIAHEINTGQMPDLSPHQEQPADFHFIERDTPESIAETIAHLVHHRIPEHFGLDPFRDIQVLTPMNRNSLGTTALNDLLQKTLNPENEIKFEIDRFGTTYRMGDKVIQTRNNYEKEVFNGDIGVITRIDTDPLSVHVRFDSAPPPATGGPDQVPHHAVRAADYEPGELDELKLAYAITIHKSQGSEFPAVVIPVSPQHYIMLQRNLIYTGITRGKKLVTLVGDKKSLGIAVRNAKPSQRHSALRDRLQQMDGGAPSAP